MVFVPSKKKNMVFVLYLVCFILHCWLWRWRNLKVHESNSSRVWKPSCFLLDSLTLHKSTKEMRNINKEDVNIK